MRHGRLRFRIREAEFVCHSSGATVPLPAALSQERGLKRFVQQSVFQARGGCSISRDMADAPEIPEAADPFEKRVAISIAILAVFLSLISNLGDNAKTDSIIKSTEVADKYSFYQAKALKGMLAETQENLLARLAPGTASAADTAKEVERLRAAVLRYESEKETIKGEAEVLKADGEHASHVNNLCDLAGLLLQVAIVVCSVAILSRWHAFWFAGITLGIVGAGIGAKAFLM